jgi:hypothetical protein
LFKHRARLGVCVCVLAAVGAGNGYVTVFIFAAFYDD